METEIRKGALLNLIRVQLASFGDFSGVSAAVCCFPGGLGVLAADYRANESR
jgi:hypothetical protein